MNHVKLILICLLFCHSVSGPAMAAENNSLKQRVVRLCNKVLEGLRGPSTQHQSPSVESAYTEVLVGHLMERFSYDADKIFWNWNVKEGVLRLEFKNNAKEFNGLLHSVGGFLAYAVEGKVSLGVWGSKKEFFDPRFKNNADVHGPTFRVGIEARPPKAMQDLFAKSNPRERNLIIGATMEVTESPVGEPTVHLFEDSDKLLEFAERLAYLMAKPNFHWVEVRWSPEMLKILQRRVNDLIEKYQP